jgi:large subunit ribosomal protein L22
VVLSAQANAKQSGADIRKLIIKSVAVNKGTVIKRFMPRARGSASPIKKRNSHITVELGLK